MGPASEHRYVPAMAKHPRQNLARLAFGTLSPSSGTNATVTAGPLCREILISLWRGSNDPITIVIHQSEDRQTTLTALVR
jgi:hypothetical protein